MQIKVIITGSTGMVGRGVLLECLDNHLNAVYVILKPLMPLLKAIPGLVTDTDLLARALIHVAAFGYGKKILESRDINQAGGQ